MLCVGMPSWTLRVVFRNGATAKGKSGLELLVFKSRGDGLGIEEDAERPRRHSHAEHGNECQGFSSSGPWVRNMRRIMS
jgi:hypothetical protein